ncbi:hypothetical protein TYRP_008020 [Tyrophagus putrescentiae]|nr:hypothetical protein TYRP_008020 [Tyrophagus putrescentiae]
MGGKGFEGGLVVVIASQLIQLSGKEFKIFGLLKLRLNDGRISVGIVCNVSNMSMLRLKVMLHGNIPVSDDFLVAFPIILHWNRWKWFTGWRQLWNCNSSIWRCWEWPVDNVRRRRLVMLLIR